jgi:ribosome-associated protein
MMKSPSTREASPAAPELIEDLLRAALSRKAFNPVCLKLDGLTSIADYFLIVSGRTGRHVSAIAEAVSLRAKERRLHELSAEGFREGRWALLDYGDVIVHVFHTPVREFYDLEDLWADAPRAAFSSALTKEICENEEDHGKDVKDEGDWEEEDVRS